jgi:hypothetical protein
MVLLLARVHPPDGAGGSFQHLVLEECWQAAGDSMHVMPFTWAFPKLGLPSVSLR